MSTEIVRHSIGEIECMAEAVAKSRLFPGVENAQSAMVLMLLCESEGLHPIQAMRRFHIIEGRPSMRADAMQAEFQRHGGRVEWLSSTREECRAVFSHPQHAPKGFEVHVTFAELDKEKITQSYDQKRNQWVLKKNWRCWPRQMLRARAVSEGVRAVDPGIVVGVYTPEEISDFDARDVAMETTARVVDEKPMPTPKPVPTPAASKARETADGLVERFNAGRPQDRHQPVVQTAAELAAKTEAPTYDARPFTTVIAEACRQVNAWFDEACDEKGIKHDPVVNVHQVMNYMTTSAVECGDIEESTVLNEKGVRTRGKVNAFLAGWHASNEEDFVGVAKQYTFGKLKEACSKHGVLLNAAGALGDGEADNEGESQDSTVVDVEYEEV